MRCGVRSRPKRCATLPNDAPTVHGFDIHVVGLADIAECRLCGLEYIVDETMMDARCCEALERLKEWAADEG